MSTTFVECMQPARARNCDVMQLAQNVDMTITVNLSTGLRTWITDNLHRGAPPAAMVDALVGRNFEPDVARGLVDAFVSAHAAGQPLPEHSVALDMEAPPLSVRDAAHRAGQRHPRWRPRGSGACSGCSVPFSSRWNVC